MSKFLTSSLLASDSHCSKLRILDYLRLTCITMVSYNAVFLLQGGALPLKQFASPHQRLPTPPPKILSLSNTKSSITWICPSEKIFWKKFITLSWNRRTKMSDNGNNVHFSGFRFICTPYLVAKSALAPLGPIMTRCRPQVILHPQNESDALRINIISII